MGTPADRVGAAVAEQVGEAVEDAERRVREEHAVEDAAERAEHAAERTERAAERVEQAADEPEPVIVAPAQLTHDDVRLIIREELAALRAGEQSAEQTETALEELAEQVDEQGEELADDVREQVTDALEEASSTVDDVPEPAELVEEADDVAPELDEPPLPRHWMHRPLPIPGLRRGGS